MVLEAHFKSFERWAGLVEAEVETADGRIVCLSIPYEEVRLSGNHVYFDVDVLSERQAPGPGEEDDENTHSEMTQALVCPHYDARWRLSQEFFWVQKADIIPRDLRDLPFQRAPHPEVQKT